MLKVGTVCTGIGSPELALQELEIPHEIVFGCEIDKYAKQTYLANFNPQNMFSDMTKPDILEHYVDLFIGGIPCQSFSLAGKRLGELDPRGLLFYNFYNYVKKQQPKYFIIENVKGLLSTGNVFQTWLELLGQSVNTHYNMFNHEDSLLYDLHWTVLNSKDFGVPQNRERVFIVGIRNDIQNDFRFPVGWHLDKRLKDILEPVVDEKYYLSDKMVENLMIHKERNDALGNGFGVNFPDLDGVSHTIKVGGKGKDDLIKVGYINQDSQASAVYSAEGTSPTISAGTHGYALGYINEPTCVAMRGRNPENSSDRTTGSPTEQRLEPNSQGITNTITSVQKENLILVGNIPGYEQDGRIYSDDSLCPTLDTKANKRPHFTTKQRIRRLTPLECFRLQGFPDQFIKPCSDTQTYKQAGNSITVSVIQAIIKNLIK